MITTTHVLYAGPDRATETITHINTLYCNSTCACTCIYMYMYVHNIIIHTCMCLQYRCHVCYSYIGVTSVHWSLEGQCTEVTRM